MIPTFPVFKEVQQDDWSDVLEFTRHYAPYSDFNFVSMWSWDTSSARALSVLNGNLVARITDYETLTPTLSFLGTHESSETCLALLAYARANGIEPTLRLVPEISIQGVDRERLTILPDEDNFDYVYLVKHLARMEGGTLKSRRKAADRFLRTHQDSRFDFLLLSDLDIQQAILTLMHDIETNKCAAGKEVRLVHEVDALRRLSKLASVDTLRVAVLSVEEKMIAFSVEELVSPTWSLGHFWKADTRYVGVYECLARETARFLEKLGVVYWNWEQDLGTLTLRANKNGYRPTKFLKKYVVRDALTNAR